MNIKENLLNPAERGVKYNYNKQVVFLFKNEWNVPIDIIHYRHIERFN